MVIRLNMWFRGVLARYDAPIPPPTLTEVIDELRNALLEDEPQNLDLRSCGSRRDPRMRDEDGFLTEHDPEPRFPRNPPEEDGDL